VRRVGIFIIQKICTRSSRTLDLHQIKQDSKDLIIHYLLQQDSKSDFDFHVQINTPKLRWVIFEHKNR
jgi:hypothetical protein